MFSPASRLASTATCLIALAVTTPSAIGQAAQFFEVTGFEVADPLFEELFSDRPTPGVFLAYNAKYDGRKDRRGAISLEQHRYAAKRFGARYVLAEQLDQAVEYGFIPYGHRDDPEYANRGLSTKGKVVEVPRGVAAVSLPDGSLPEVHGGRGWIMDPRYLKELSRQLEQRGRNNEHDYVSFR